MEGWTFGMARKRRRIEFTVEARTLKQRARSKKEAPHAAGLLSGVGVFTS
jgi:hypothetical protein